VDSTLDLTGPAALVTGARSSTDIGFATARPLALTGAAAVLTSMMKRTCDQTSEPRDAAGAHVEGVVGDLTDPVTSHDAANLAIELFGSIDRVWKDYGSQCPTESSAGAIGWLASRFQRPIRQFFML
jgi:NAD(P)-dependent dehydrogenase (short-subunit alcohol dehydrogenase family)